MIIWSEHLYMDEKIMKKPNKYKKAVEKRKFHTCLYLVTLSGNEKNLLDIYRSGELWFEHYRRNDIQVLGLAHSRESAKELARDIILEVYNRTGAFNIRAYFERQALEMQKK